MLHRAIHRAWHNQVTIAQFNKPTLCNLYTSQWQSRSLQRIRSFRSGKAKRSDANPSPANCGHESGPVPKGNLMRAALFTGAFSLGCFAGATIMEYENTRSLIIAKAKQARTSWWHKSQQERDQLAQLKADLRRHWDMLGPGEKVFVPICALNLIVFGLWRIPSLRSTMLTYFTSNPAARIVCWPMFLSTFSHYSALHIFANMYVLHSFSNAAAMSLGKEQFLALYLSAGVISSLTSVFYKAATLQAGVSLGASGAIMAILAFVCAQYPDTQLSILFLPTVTFSAGSAIKVIMGIDFAGCVMGWKIFDHAAHLGGAIFGLFWAYYGAQLWAKRITLLNYYHELRKSKQK